MPDSTTAMHPVDRRKHVAALVTALEAQTGSKSQQQVFLEMLLSAVADFNEDLARVLIASVRAAKDRDFDLPMASYPWLSNAYNGGPLDFPEKYSVDLFILAVKSVELHAVLDVFGCRADDQSYRSPLYRDACGKELWIEAISGLSVGIGWVAEDGLVETAIAMAQYRGFVQFTGACLIGMAGGKEGKVQLGDVVVATDIVDYDRRRAVDGASDDVETAIPVDRPEWRMVSADDDWRQFVTRLADHAEMRTWLDSVRSEMPDWTVAPINMPGRPVDGITVGCLPSDWMGRVLVAPILSGGAIVESPNELRRLLTLYHPEAIALEMEGYGFAKWCKVNRVARWLVIRGIADLCGPNAGQASRSKEWQYPSTYFAARLLRDHLLLRVFAYQ